MGVRTDSTSSRLSGRLWLLFALFIVYGCTVPFLFTTDRAFIAKKWSHVSWNPLVASETGQRPLISDVVQNFLLFMPFGALGILARPSSSRSILPRIVMVTGLATALSLGVETAQLFTLNRDTSLTDVTTDTLGALGGAIAAHLTRRVGARAVRALTTGALVDAKVFYPFFVAAIVVCVGAWEPFDISFQIGSVVKKIHVLQRNMWQYGGPTDEGIVVIHYVLLAVAACMWLDRVRVRGAAVVALLVGVPLAVGFEASQILISTRMPGLEHAVLRASAVVLGSVLWSVGRHVRAPRAWLALLVVATAAAAAIQNLSPFKIAPWHRAVEWLPFMRSDAYLRTETLSHVMELWLLYFPLGFIFGMVSPQSTRAMAAAFLVSLAIAASIAYGQGWIVGRYPDVTDIALSALGGWFGAWVGTSGATAFTRATAALNEL